MRGAAGILCVVLSACAPSTEGQLIEPQGASSLLVLTRAEETVTEVFGIELSQDSLPVWFPKAEAHTEVLRYPCSLSELGLPAGPIPLGDEGRPLPSSASASVPADLRVVAPLPACRPVQVRRDALPKPVRWLSPHKAGVLIGHAGGLVTWVEASGQVRTQMGPDSLYGVGQGQVATLFFADGGSQPYANGSSTGPRLQLENGLWTRWMTSTSTRSETWLLTDRGAVLRLGDGRVQLSERLPSFELGQATVLAAGAEQVWASAQGLPDLYRLKEPTGPMPAPPGRVSALAEVQGVLLAGTEAGEVFAWQAGAWSLKLALGEEIRAMAAAGSSALVLTRGGGVFVFDLEAGRVCEQARLNTAVGQHVVAVEGGLAFSPSESPAALWQVSLTEGRACPDPQLFSPL